LGGVVAVVFSPLALHLADAPLHFQQRLEAGILQLQGKVFGEEGLLHRSLVHAG